ncbi:26S proteasome non-ATPase regulatory subunit 9 [Achroia grisella]|uniref:26S proteasome non-ATPase regulatory subunit 9 n=1 Tax=Achroia grisella TaxID=688607 RepID=UPI0027D306A7|nr:26S proteasome non-ATPase regulatory subunit 9 [Achroia grisella]
MVSCNIETPNDKARRLMREKDKIEQEIAELNAVLNTNNVGMREPLVDDEGFPRNDIDVARVRHARHRIICLQNDHKDKMKEIETALAELHAEARADGAGPSNRYIPVLISNGRPINANAPNGHVPNGNVRNGNVPNGHAANGGDIAEPRPNDAIPTMPIAFVSSVCEGSPAYLAGIRSEDAILQFGSLHISNMRESNLRAIHELVNHSIGQRIRVWVKRGNDILNLVVVPRLWLAAADQNRRSLLGANLRTAGN